MNRAKCTLLLSSIPSRWRHSSCKEIFSNGKIQSSILQHKHLKVKNLLSGLSLLLSVMLWRLLVIETSRLSKIHCQLFAYFCNLLNGIVIVLIRFSALHWTSLYRMKLKMHSLMPVWNSWKTKPCWQVNDCWFCRKHVLNKSI